MAQHDVVFLGYELLNMQYECVCGPVHIQIHRLYNFICIDNIHQQVRNIIHLDNLNAEALGNGVNSPSGELSS
jgi:hypothetical protein